MGREGDQSREKETWIVKKGDESIIVGERFNSVQGRRLSEKSVGKQ